MPKRPTYQPGHYYHIYNRGRSRLSICHQPADFLEILKQLKQYSTKLSLTIIAYVLLPNHYHLLVRQDALPRASLLPQRVFNSYSKRYNLKYQHSGTIFEGPAKAKAVDNQPYLQHLCRYIHCNPVLHGISPSLEEWDYSNYAEWMGERNGTLVDHQFIKEQFGLPADYQQFVLDYLKARQEPEGFGTFLDL